MAIKDALGSAAKKIKGAYKAGDDESTGLGAELKEKARGMKEAGGALKPSESKPEPAGKPSPMKPAQGPYGSQGDEKRIDTSSYSKPLGSFKKGGKVKKTGPYLLHKGEAVLNKKDTKKMSALGGQASDASVGAPDGMSIDKLDDGSFHIQHRNNGPEKDGAAPKQPGKFSARNVKHLVRHVKQAFGGGQSDDGMAEPSSFADGGVVEKSGLAQVHAGEKVIPAPVKNPDIYLGGNKPKAPTKPLKKYQPTPGDRERITESTSVV